MALVPAPWQDRVDVFRRYDVDAGNVWLVLGDVPGRGRRRGRAADLHRGPAVHAGAGRVRARLRVARRLPRPARGGRRVDPRIRGQALIGRAQLSLPGDPAGAEPPARAGLDLCRAAGDQFWTAAGLNLLSEIAVHTGRPDEAETLSQEAAGDRRGRGRRLERGLGARHPRRDRRGARATSAAAAELASASIEVMRSIDHRWGVARAQLGLGDLARLRGDFGGAQRMYADALGYLREIGARPEIARCLAGLGRVALDLGDTGDRPGATWPRACGSAGTSAPASGSPAALSRAPRSPTARATPSGRCCWRPRRPALRAAAGLPPAARRPRRPLPGRRRPPRRRRGRAAVGARARPQPRGRHRAGHRPARGGHRGRASGPDVPAAPRAGPAAARRPRGSWRSPRSSPTA